MIENWQHSVFAALAMLGAGNHNPLVLRPVVLPARSDRSLASC